MNISTRNTIVVVFFVLVSIFGNWLVTGVLNNDITSKINASCIATKNDVQLVRVDVSNGLIAVNSGLNSLHDDLVVVRTLAERVVREMHPDTHVFGVNPDGGE